MLVDVPVAQLAGVGALITALAFLGFLAHRAILKRNSLIALEKEYERVREQRDEMQFHIDWALSSNDRDSAARLLQERNRLDRKLESLQQNYIAMKDGDAKASKQH